jgi:putative heme-binding domain-containing protein
MFDASCAGCHGPGGEGGRGPALNTGTFRSGGSDREVFLTVKNGVPNTEMPGSRQGDPEIWKLVAYVKQLPRGSRPEGFSGDARAGLAVYAAQRCATCHMIQGEGGDVGPDLSRAGVRAAQFLRDSIVKPGADVPLSYLTVNVTTAAGQTIRGIRLNEDDYSMQLRDASGNPRSFLKSGLTAFRHERESLMPAYTALQAVDLENLMAYLGSLK